MTFVNCFSWKMIPSMIPLMFYLHKLICLLAHFWGFVVAWVGSYVLTCQVFHILWLESTICVSLLCSRLQFISSTFIRAVVNRCSHKVSSQSSKTVLPMPKCISQICLSILYIYVSTYLCIYVFNHLSVYVSMFICVCVYMYVFLYLFMFI